jgi:hypothetical protein
MEEEATQALTADLNQLLQDGFVLPFSVVAMDAPGHLYAGTYTPDPAGGCVFQETVDALGPGLRVPHYYLIIDALGQAAVREVVYRGQEGGALIEEGERFARFASRLRRIN